MEDSTNNRSLLHAHARLVDVRSQQLRLLNRVAPPSNELRRMQPRFEQRQIALDHRCECVRQAHPGIYKVGGTACDRQRGLAAS